MNKLGFVIRLASQGAGNAIECNKGQWTNKVVDICEYLKLFNGLQGTDNIVTFMSFDEGGCFLTQFRAISGRLGDFLSGWIYIPNTIDISGSDVLDAYNFVRRILRESNLNDLKESINDFFSKEYPLNNYSAQYTPSHGDKFGVRFIGHYSLQEILDDRYQSYYCDCKAIFILEENGDVSITKEAGQSIFKNYTKIEITKTAILIPPTQQELQEVGRGTRILTTTGQEFEKPTVVSIGSQKTFILHRDGFEDLQFKITVKSEQQKLAIPASVEWTKRISVSMFKIYNSKHEDIGNILVKVLVNGKDITNNNIFVPENECNNALVEVQSDEYELFKNRINLLTGPYDVKLTRKTKCFKSRIELANGKDGDITIESKYITSEYDSPLKGYTIDEDRRGEKHLRVSDGFIWKQRMYGFLAALIMGILFIGYISFDTWIDTHHFKFGLPPWEPNSISSGEGQVITDTLQKTAINYLDSNDIWEKSEMDKYSCLCGLYDNLNNFELDSVCSKYSAILSASIKLRKIVDAANKTLQNRWNPKQGIHYPTYNKENNERINVTNYIKWLDNNQTKDNNQSLDNNQSKDKNQTVNQHKNERNGGL